MSTIKDFKDLFVWQEGHKLVLLVYKNIKNFPKEETYGLSSQMTRAVVSVTSNIAEGFGRQGYKEKTQFYYLAQCSLIELKKQLEVAKDVGYINEKEYKNIYEQSNIVHRLLQGLIKKTKSFLNPKS